MDQPNPARQAAEQKQEPAKRTPTSIEVCEPNAEECTRLNYAMKYNYIFTLSELITKLEELDDQEGLDGVCRGYGNGDYIAAVHLRISHPERFPAAVG